MIFLEIFFGFLEKIKKAKKMIFSPFSKKIGHLKYSQTLLCRTDRNGQMENITICCQKIIQFQLQHYL